MPTSKTANQATRPKVSTVITQATPTSKPVISSRERQTYTRLSVTEDDVTGADKKVDPAAIVRVLGLFQDNVHDATLPQRSHPLGQVVVLEKQVFTSGKNTVLRHGLGEAFARYQCLRSYAGSQPFQAVEVANNANMDPTLYLVLVASSTGTYDIGVYPA